MVQQRFDVYITNEPAPLNVQPLPSPIFGDNRPGAIQPALTFRESSQPGVFVPDSSPGLPVLNSTERIRSLPAPQVPGGGLSAGRGQTLVSPYRTRDTFSNDGVFRRRPTSTGGPGQLSRTIPFAYGIARLVDQLIPPPCPWLTNEEFFSLLESDENTARERIFQANTFQQVSDSAATTCLLNAGAAALLTFIPGTQPVGAALGAKVPYTCGLALGALGVNSAAQRTARNLQIIQARAYTSRAVSPITREDCPVPQEREPLNRVSDCCKPEIFLLPHLTVLSGGGAPEPEPGVLVDIGIFGRDELIVASLFYQDQSKNISIPNGSRTYETQIPIFSQEIDLDVDAITFKLIVVTSGGTYSALAKLELGDCSCVATIPESWPTKLGANRPQVVYLFRDIREDGSYGQRTKQIQVPYYQTDSASVQRPPTYQTGAYQGLLLLPDNSKFVVYAENRGAAEEMVNFAKSVIPGDLLESAQERYGEVVIKDSRLDTFECVRADYYPTGQKDLRPEWSKRFSPTT